MLRRLIVVAVVVALALALAVPALATHTPGATGCERAHECGEGYEAYLPDGYTIADSTALYLWNPLRGEWGIGGVYGAMALCQNDGGYWYDGGDGYAYWNSCGGTM